MDKLNLMNSFVHIAERGSYTEAAQQLRKTKALMSTHVSQLESMLGVRLLQRSTRGIKLTEEGRHYFEQSKRILDDISTIEMGLKDEHQTIAGRLRISAPTTFGECVLMPFVADFIAQHPALKMEVVFNDRFVDLVSEGYDVAIRVGQLSDLDLVAVPVGSAQLKACASIGFIKRYGQDFSPQDLAKLPAIYDVNTKSNAYSCVDDLGKKHSFQINSCITVNNAIAAAQLAVHSEMMTISPDFAVDPLIASGKLYPIMDKFHFEPMPVNVLYSQRKYLLTKVNVFNQALKHYLSNQASI